MAKTRKQRILDFIVQLKGIGKSGWADTRRQELVKELEALNVRTTYVEKTDPMDMEYSMPVFTWIQGRYRNREVKI